MTVPAPSIPTEVAMSQTSALRKRVSIALVAVLSLAVGMLIGDRFVPFRGSGVSYTSSCSGILSVADMGFIPQTTFTGRRITTATFDESGKGDSYRFDCTVYGDGDEQLQARARMTTSDAEAWQEELKDRGRLSGRVKSLRVNAGDSERANAAGLSADSSAAYYLPCKLTGDATVHLNISVTAPGASDGNADEQRLTIAAIASRLAYHSFLEAGCLKPFVVPDQSPSFAS